MPAPASLPPGRRIYAIGDIHGCLDRLLTLHERIAADLAARPVERPLVLHVGDYVDRGPDSAGVVRHLLRGFPGAEVVNLMGNHEHMMLDALDAADPGAFDHWMQNGGRASLRSWQVPNGAAGHARRDLLPAEHLRFLRGLALHHREGGYLFVHAGDPAGRADRAAITGRSDVDPRAVPVLDGRSRRRGGAWPHADGGPRGQIQPDRHRHGSGAWRTR